MLRTALGSAWGGLLLLPLLLPLAACGAAEAPPPEWEVANQIVPLPSPPLGIQGDLAELPDPPTPERVRLGRWLFFERRLSTDGAIACASCHHPEQAFSELTAHSTGIGGKQGTRKAQSVINLAWTLYPHFLWDGRAATLEAQAAGLLGGAAEMGRTTGAMEWTLAGLEAYVPYFEEAFGSAEITVERVAEALADYERTRMSGNSPWDRWRAGDPDAVGEEVKRGHELFFGEAGCNRCHLGQNFTDSTFHNLGVGWDPAAGEFRDPGRFKITGEESKRGAFKTPSLREVGKHPPFMHDGSIATLREVVEFYNFGGHPNPTLDPKMKPLGLSEEEIDLLLAFLAALEGEGYEDEAPAAFPS